MKRAWGMPAAKLVARLDWNNEIAPHMHYKCRSGGRAWWEICEILAVAGSEKWCRGSRRDGRGLGSPAYRTLTGMISTESCTSSPR
jgi:hypothetical protein